MDKVLITGGSGLLGSNLAWSTSERFDTCLTYNKNRVEIKGCTSSSLDLRNRDAVFRWIEEMGPDVIVHCAALTNVDYCEKHLEEAQLLNAGVTKNLAEISEKTGCKFIYISTDSVFDGEKGMYREENKPNPINVYARTKLEGELSVRDACNDYAIVRTNIYGWNVQSKLSLAEWFLENLRNKREINGFTDVYFTPILVNNLSDAILKLYEKDGRGIYNISGSERVSKYEFGVKLAEVFQLDNNLIKRANADEFNFIAKRPKDTSLDVGKVKKELGINLLGVEEGLLEFKNLEKNGYVSRLRRCLK